MFKYEKEEILKEFRKQSKKARDEAGYMESSGWHMGLWLAEEILENILDGM